MIKIAHWSYINQFRKYGLVAISSNQSNMLRFPPLSIHSAPKFWNTRKLRPKILRNGRRIAPILDWTDHRWTDGWMRKGLTCQQHEVKQSVPIVLTSGAHLLRVYRINAPVESKCKHTIYIFAFDRRRRNCVFHNDFRWTQSNGKHALYIKYIPWLIDANYQQAKTHILILKNYILLIELFLTND